MGTIVGSETFAEENESKIECGVSARVHNIFLHSYRVPEYSYICVKAFLSINPKNNDKSDYNLSYLNFLCDLVSFPFENIRFTNRNNSKNTTLWDDIINDKQLYDQFMNINVNSPNSK